MVLRSILVSIFIVMSVSQSPLGATKHFVSKSGDDSNNGSNWVTAWRTTAKVNQTIQTGDTIIFGTGTWYNSRLEPPFNGYGGLPTIYACSTWAEMPSTWAGEGKNLSKIYAGDSVTNWTFWKMIGSDSAWWAVWTPILIGGEGPGKCVCLVQNDSAMIRCEGLARTDLSRIDGPGQFVYTYAEGDTMFACLHGGANPNHAEVLASSTNVVGLAGGNNNCYFKGLHLFHSNAGTIRFTGPADSNRFEFCAIRYGSGYYNNNSACIYSTQYVASQDSSDYGWHNTFYACSIGVVSQPASDFGNNIAGAIIYSQWHMYFDSCYFERTLGHGIFWKAPSAMHGSYCVTRKCVFDSPNGYGVYCYWNPVGDSIYGNIILNSGSSGIWLGRATGPYDYTNIRILNNTIFNPRNYQFANAYYDGITGSGNLLQYNIGYGGGHASATDQNIVAFSEGREASYTVDSNLWVAEEGGQFLGACDGGSGNWGRWQSGCGLDANGDTSWSSIGWADTNTADVTWQNVWGKFSRPGASNEMNLTYGGRNWRVFGAVQDADTSGSGGSDTFSPVSLTVVDQGNLAQGIAPNVSGTYPGYNAAIITDGNVAPYGGTATTWASDENGSSPHWVEIDFGSPKVIKNVVIHWAWNSYQSAWMTSQEYYVQEWTGSDYSTIAVVDNPTAGDYTVTGFSAVTTSKIRIFQPVNMGPAIYPTVMWLTEIRVF